MPSSLHRTFTSPFTFEVLLTSPVPTSTSGPVVAAVCQEGSSSLPSSLIFTVESSLSTRSEGTWPPLVEGWPFNGTVATIARLVVSCGPDTLFMRSPCSRKTPVKICSLSVLALDGMVNTCSSTYVLPTSQSPGGSDCMLSRTSRSGPTLSMFSTRSPAPSTTCVNIFQPLPLFFCVCQYMVTLTWSPAFAGLGASTRAPSNFTLPSKSMSRCVPTSSGGASRMNAFKRSAAALASCGLSSVVVLVVGLPTQAVNSVKLSAHDKLREIISSLCSSSARRV